jgi:hypothetical protein
MGSLFGGQLPGLLIIGRQPLGEESPKRMFVGLIGAEP